MTQNVKNKELVVFCQSDGLEKVSAITMVPERPKMMVDNWDRNALGFRRMVQENAEIEVIKDILDGCNVTEDVRTEKPTTSTTTDGLYHPPGPHVHQNYGNDTKVIDQARHVHADHAHRKPSFI